MSVAPLKPIEILNQGNDFKNIFDLYATESCAIFNSKDTGI